MSAGPEIFGRYALYRELASGGMATVHFGRLLGPAGFARTVAIKRLHPQFAKDAEFVTMFLDEARLAARIHHPHVVPTIDVVSEGGELLLVMEYVHGESLSRLMRERPVPPAIAAAIVSGVLHGLQAAHDAKNERGEALGIVHRDVSPQNVLVGADGLARVLDFGIAKAVDRLATTREGVLKGKLAYMAPEQLLGNAASRQSDIYATAVVLWEALVGRRLFDGDQGEIIGSILNDRVPPPSEEVERVPPELDAIVLRGLARDLRARFDSAGEMALAIERTTPVARASEVAAWLQSAAKEALAARAGMVEEIESGSSRLARVAPAAAPREEAQPREEGTQSAVSASVVAKAPRPRPWLLGGLALALGGAAAVVWFVARERASPEAPVEPAAIEPPAAGEPLAAVPAAGAAPSTDTTAVQAAPATSPLSAPPAASPSAAAARPIPRPSTAPAPAAPQPSRDVYGTRRRP
jgi:serine/threonine-protein kinase